MIRLLQGVAGTGARASSTYEFLLLTLIALPSPHLKGGDGLPQRRAQSLGRATRIVAIAKPSPARPWQSCAVAVRRFLRSRAKTAPARHRSGVQRTCCYAIRPATAAARAASLPIAAQRAEFPSAGSKSATTRQPAQPSLRVLAEQVPTIGKIRRRVRSPVQSWPAWSPSAHAASNPQAEARPFGGRAGPLNLNIQRFRSKRPGWHRPPGEPAIRRCERRLRLQQPQPASRGDEGCREPLV